MNLYTLPSNPAAEFTTYSDTRGAAKGLAAAAGVAINLTPLDATTKTPFSPALWATLPTTPAIPKAQYTGVLLGLVRRTWSDLPALYTAVHLWGPSAPLTVTCPALVTGAVPTEVRVVVGPPWGPSTGWTPACTDAEAVASGRGSFSVWLVCGGDGPAVGAWVQHPLQAGATSAARGLRCWGEHPGGPQEANDSARGGVSGDLLTPSREPGRHPPQDATARRGKVGWPFHDRRCHIASGPPSNPRQRHRLGGRRRGWGGMVGGGGPCGHCPSSEARHPCCVARIVWVKSEKRKK